MNAGLERSNLIDNMVSHLPAFRALIDITQEKLAEVIGIGRQTYMAIESGKAKMRWDTFVTLSVIFSFNENTRDMASMLHLNIDDVKNYLLFPSDKSVGDKNFSNAQKLLNEYNTNLAAFYFENAGAQFIKESRLEEAIEAYEKALYCLELDNDPHLSEVQEIINRIKNR